MKWNWMVSLILLAVHGTFVASLIALPVKLEQLDGKWTIIRDGKPYRIHGAAGPWRLQLLASRGANSTRNWGVGKDTARMLDAAHANGISVTLCISIPRLSKEPEKWRDTVFVDEQLARIREAVTAHRGHPALLFWSIGNEAEVDEDAYYAFVERAAKLIRELDPDHPVLSIVAEVGKAKARRIATSCPSVDLLGVNSYAGMGSLSKRLTDQGWTKPFVITEFGPHGQWEVRKTDFGAPIEQTSTQKTAVLAKYYETVIDVDPRCVGSYVFLWGQKQESTHTWYGLLTEDGRMLEQVDVAERYWTGKWPADRGPTVELIKSDLAEKRIAPGTRGSATIAAIDPEGKPLKYRWELRTDRGGGNNFGAAEAKTEVLADLVTDADKPTCAVVAPNEPGRYRLFVEVEDAGGKIATANLPFFVE